MTKTEIINRLTVLGKTKEEVAKSLYDLGIRGKKYSSGECPISNYLNTYTKNFVGSSHTYIHFDDMDECNFIIFEDNNLSQIGQFIESFDNGEFLELQVLEKI